MGTPTGTPISHGAELRKKGRKVVTQSSWPSAALNLFPGTPLSRILGLWFKLPFDSRANYPSVTKYEQSDKCRGRNGVNSF